MVSIQLMPCQQDNLRYYTSHWFATIADFKENLSVVTGLRTEVTQELEQDVKRRNYLTDKQCFTH